MHFCVFIVVCTSFPCEVCFLSVVLSDLTSKDVHYVQLFLPLFLSISLPLCLSVRVAS